MLQPPSNAAMTVTKRRGANVVRRPRGLRVTVAGAWRGQQCSDDPSAEHRTGPWKEDALPQIEGSASEQRMHMA